MKAHLNIVIDDDGKAKVTYIGDMSKIAPSIIRLAKAEEDFALALNVGMNYLQDDLKAIRLRDEMVGIINNTVKK